jgi:hypothetical protein
MIDIPEERILKEITDILINDLPKVLLELEEQSEDSIRLPPFRYVGLEENLPPGTPLPYALVEIEEGEYTEKDRIVKSIIYMLKISINYANISLCWRYLAGIRIVCQTANSITHHYHVKKMEKTIVLKLHIIK